MNQSEEIKSAEDEMQVSYCRIDFHGCNLGYDYCICKWHEIPDQISQVEYDFDDWQDDGQNMPSITFTPVVMSIAEYKRMKSEIDIED